MEMQTLTSKVLVISLAHEIGLGGFYSVMENYRWAAFTNMIVQKQYTESQKEIHSQYFCMLVQKSEDYSY